MKGASLAVVVMLAGAPALAGDPGEWVQAWVCPLDLHVRRVAFSGDRLLAAGHSQRQTTVGCQRSGLLVFAGASGELLERRDAAPDWFEVTDRVFPARLATSAAGHVVFSEPGAVQVWTSLDQPPRRLACDGDPLRVAISRDGRFVAAGGRGDGVFLWDLNSDSDAGPRVLTGHRSRVTDLSFSPDGATLATIGFFELERGGGNVRLWSTATGRVIHQLQPGALIPPQIVFSGDGQTCVTIGVNGELRRYDAATGQHLEVVDTDRDVLAVAMTTAQSPDGSLLALSGDGKVTVVELATGKVQATLPAGSTFGQLAFGPGGDWLAVLGERLVMWHRGPAPPVRRAAPRPPSGDVLTFPEGFEALCFAPDGGDLFAPEDGGEINRLRAVAGHLERVQRFGARWTAWLGTYDDTLVQVAAPVDAPASVVLYRLSDGGEEATITTKGMGRPEHFAHRGRCLLVQFREPTTRVGVFDLDKRKLTAVIALEAAALAVGPKGKRFAFSYFDDNYDAWTEVRGLRRGAKAQELPRAGALSGLAYGPKGRFLYGIEGTEGEARVFRARDATTLEEAWSLQLGKDATAVAYGPSGRWFVYDEAKSARLLDLERRQTTELLSFFLLGGVAFSPDGRRLAVSHYRSGGGETRVQPLPE